MAASDYYTLGLSPGASQEQIRAAYRRLAFQYHPDRNPGREGWAAEQFKRVNQAYEALSSYHIQRQAEQRYEGYQRQSEAINIQLINLMAQRGAVKMALRVGDIWDAYEDSKRDAVYGYNRTPFNRQMKRNYADGIRNAHIHIDPVKWRANWARKVQ